MAFSNARLLARVIVSPLARSAYPRAVTVSSSQRKLREMDYGGVNATLNPYGEEKQAEKRELRGPSRKPLDVEAPPECRAATASISKFSRERLYKEAIDVFKQTEQRDAILTSAALNACAKGLLLQDALQIWDEMNPEWRSVVSYTTMIDLCKRLRQVDRAERLFNEMRQVGVEPNAITYNVMISAYSAAGRPTQAFETFEALRSSLLPTASTVTKQMAYLAVMSAFARVGDYAKTRELFVELAADGTAPNNLHVNALLTSCAKAPDAPTAQAIFDMLPSYNLQPRLEEWAILLSCQRYDLPRCQAIVAEMRQAQIEPTSICVQQLFQAHVLAKDAPGARALLDQADSLDRESRTVRELIQQLEELEASPMRPPMPAPSQSPAQPA